MVKSLLFLLVIALLSTSCSQIGRSGRHIQISSDEDAQAIAKRFNVTKDLLLSANPGKTFLPGTWVFIPQDRGVVGRHTTKSYSFADSAVSAVAVSLKPGEFMWPVPASRRVSSYFGKRWGRHHDGIDIPAKRGTHILATRSGMVVYSGSDLGGYGNIIVIAHPGGYFSVYAHNNKNFVHKGQNVHQGQVIAQVGSTGRSTGPHLHFEIRHDGQAYNPIAFVGNPKRKRGRGVASK